MAQSKSPWVLVTSISHFRELLKKTDIFIITLGRGIHSSKDITEENDGRFSILNNIDGTMQILTESELFTKSNIGTAIKKKAFYARIGD